MSRAHAPNINNIKNYRNGILIKQAKNKKIFLAFCIEYNSWFETYLPIQMDATCYGFQHLSLLSLDSKLGQELNLNESTWDDKPKDFYSFVVVCFIDYLKTELSENKNLELAPSRREIRILD